MLVASTMSVKSTVESTRSGSASLRPAESLSPAGSARSRQRASPGRRSEARGFDPAARQGARLVSVRPCRGSFEWSDGPITGRTRTSVGTRIEGRNSADVDVEVRAQVGDGGRGTDAQAEDVRAKACSSSCVASGLNPGNLGSPAPSEADRGSIGASPRFAAPPPPARADTGSRAPHEAGCGLVEHEAGCSLWVGGSEERAERAPVPDRIEDGTSRSRFIHHRPDVVHPRLERGHAVDWVRHPCPSLVEDDQSSQPREAVKERAHRRVFPAQLDVVRPTWHVDEVGRSVADDLVGDVDLSTFRISGDGRGHVASLSVRG